MRKYKIVEYKKLENLFVYRRYLFFFWKKVNSFKTVSAAYDYVEKQKDWDGKSVRIEVNIKEYWTDD
jgi:hypothetical protein